MLNHHIHDKLKLGDIAIHRHWNAYATIVRRGNYAEAAIEGQLNLGPGAIVLHPHYHLHSNVVRDEGAVWNIALHTHDVGGWRALRGPAVERLAARDKPPHPEEVLEVAERSEEIAFEPLPFWLSDIARMEVADFARAPKAVSREHAHRTFKRHFGMPPGRYRRERQLQRALRLFGSDIALADVATAAGFSDQSHMTRIFGREFGLTPTRLRDKITPVQDTLCRI